MTNVSGYKKPAIKGGLSCRPGRNFDIIPKLRECMSPSPVTKSAPAAGFFFSGCSCPCWCLVLFLKKTAEQNATNNGAEIKDNLDKLKIEHQPQYFTPADHRSILKELLHYHLKIAQQQPDNKTTEELNSLLQML